MQFIVARSTANAIVCNCEIKLMMCLFASTVNDLVEVPGEHFYFLLDSAADQADHQFDEVC